MVGKPMRFQSYANRNWVAKIARTRYGVNTDSYVSKDQLFDPANTVEGFDLNPGSEFYMNLYCASLVEVAKPAPVSQPTRSTFANSYHGYEGNIW